MGSGKLITVVFLVVALAVIVGVLLLETSRGPSFRPGDYADLAECLRNIPSEWQPGSAEYEGARTACAYTHGHGQPMPQ
ncbi:MAG TPA: hypothetical protein VKZ58_00765 [Longimicrobiales bacterium]|nr:hypothetical protein [Longimicrobiales bacterium]